MNNAVKLAPTVDWKKDIGPLKALLMDDTISEIMVNNWKEIYVERNGKMELSQTQFSTLQSFNQCVQALCIVAGREVNRRSPFLDAHLPDGSRMNVVVPPVSINGPILTIRKAQAATVDYRAMVAQGTFTEKVAYFLNKAVDARLNIIVTGASSSGKTSLLSVLTSFVDSPQRLIVIEDSSEVIVQVKNHVRMEVPQATPGEVQVTMADLLRNALRMRPDRIVIGECRGDEALDMLMAMNTGHKGSMTTVHANSAMDGLARLESMVMRSGNNIPRSFVQENIAGAIHLIIHTELNPNGKRQISEILEIRGWKDDKYETATLFKWTAERGLLSTGVFPAFVAKSTIPGIKFFENFFHPDQNVKLS